MPLQMHEPWVLRDYLLQRPGSFGTSAGSLGKSFAENDMGMALYSAGLYGFRYCRLSYHLEQMGDALDEGLARIASSGDCNMFVSTMIDCLRGSLEDAFRRLQGCDIKRKIFGVEGATMRGIVRLARTGEDFQLSDALYLGDCGVQAFRKRLNRLVEGGIIEKTGNLRSSRYRLVDPLDEVFCRCGGRRMHLGMVVGSSPEADKRSIE